LFEFETESLGIPSHVSGNAFRHATSSQVNVSVGIFSSLKPLTQPTSYQDFFTCRLQKISPITHEHSYFDKYERVSKINYFSRFPGITFDIISPPKDYVKYLQNLELIQFGKGRNRGYGLVRLVDALEINIDDIKLPNTATHATLLSPLFYIPKYFEKYNCRKKYQVIWNHGKKKRIQTIPTGQFFRLQKERNVKAIARAGILRKNLFGQFGLGEFLLHNWTGGN